MKCPCRARHRDGWLVLRTTKLCLGVLKRSGDWFPSRKMRTRFPKGRKA